MKRLVLFLSVGLAAVMPCLLLPGTASASAPYDYLRVGPSEVLFVQFTVTDQSVVGVMHDDVLNVSPADQSTFTPAHFSISPNVYNFTGTDDSGHLNLHQRQLNRHLRNHYRRLSVPAVSPERRECGDAHLGRVFSYRL